MKIEPTPKEPNATEIAAILALVTLLVPRALRGFGHFTDTEQVIIKSLICQKLPVKNIAAVIITRRNNENKQ